MKALTYTDSRHMNIRGKIFIRPLQPATLLRRFQLHIETSDWDEQIIRKQPIIDKACLIVVILSGLALFPCIVAAFLK
ncbi:MAG: hypothetical protein C0394_08825 [Syntrophus sp. (in: bacteria)]|nr:hypothetical protein [Syntrophus sp. (in: bacteria)]